MPNPEDLWKKLVEEAGEDEIAAAAGVPVTHAERDLRAAGFDVKAERARASAVIAQLEGESAPVSEPGEASGWVMRPPQSGRRAPANRRAVLVAAAIAALAAGGGILYALGHRSKPPDIPVESPRAPPSAPAPPPSPQEAPKPGTAAPHDKPPM